METHAHARGEADEHPTLSQKILLPENYHASIFFSKLLKDVRSAGNSEAPEVTARCLLQFQS